MPKDLTTLFKTEAVAEEQSQLLHLMTLEVPNVPDFTFCDSNDDATYNSVVYSKFPCKFNGIEVTSTGEINKANIQVSNVDRTIESMIENYNGLRGCTLRVKTVFAKFLDDGASPSTTSYTEEIYVIDSFNATESAVQFNLEPLIDFSIKLPRRRFTSVCYWRYKDPLTCGYSGGLATCKKDLLDCKAHNNLARFGGFPGVPTNGTRRIFF